MMGDLLVVGASPAGIIAAISAAEKGAEVILVDKDLGSFDHPANTFFEGMVSRAGFEVNDCYVMHRLEGMSILSPKNHRIDIASRGYFIDRKKFDDYYLKIADRLGVTLLKSEVISSNLHNGKRDVLTTSGEIRARVVIDAGGVSSIISRKAGLLPLCHPQDIAWAMEATINHPGIGQEERFEYWLGSMAPGWKATFSPGGGDLATLGVFVRREQDLMPFLKTFVAHFKRYKSASYQNIDDMKIIALHRGGDPIVTLPREIVSNSLMVVGGAAGQSGMAYSMRAGKICGTVAADAIMADDASERFLSRYEQLWRSEFGWEYRTARACLETLRSMNDAKIDSLIKSLSGKSFISGGSFYRNVFAAGIPLASANPKVMLSFIKNFIKG